MRAKTYPMALAAMLGLFAGAGLAQDAGGTSQTLRQDQALAQATSWLSQRVANFVKSAHPLSVHHALQFQSATRRPDGGYRIVFDEAYKGRILGTIYWAEIAVNVGPTGSVEGYHWGWDSNFYPPYIARRVTDKYLR